MARLRENSAARGEERRKSPPREGPALLQGLAICGKCGKRMTVCWWLRNRYADLLFEVVTRRYLTVPVLITTNKPFSEWAEVFSSAACVVTLVDRLIHRSEIVHLDGESYRLREAKEQAAKRSKARSRRTAKPRASREPRS